MSAIAAMRPALFRWGMQENSHATCYHAGAESASPFIRNRADGSWDLESNEEDHSFG
jgi:hypothetical protein